jgi:hypothetical protein
VINLMIECQPGVGARIAEIHTDGNAHDFTEAATFVHSIAPQIRALDAWARDQKTPPRRRPRRALQPISSD